MSRGGALMTEQLHLTLIGCGNMGSALLAGWLNIEQIAHITIIDPDPQLPAAAHRDQRVKVFRDMAELARQEDNTRCDICLLAVKPQIMSDMMQSLNETGLRADIVISVAAGITIDTIRQKLPRGPAIVRVMPNTPSLIGQGVLAVCPGDDLSQARENDIQSLLQVCGHVFWLDTETHMNAVTAVSGSGPAYVFAMIEALAEAGRHEGLPDDLAAQLARRTVEGAAGLSAHNADTDITQLRRHVTSPGGTTEAGLKALLDTTQGLTPLLTRTVSAARQRGDDLGS